MRLYHYTTAQWALDDIRQRRIKIAEYHNCNDPFELGCFVGSRKARLALRVSKDDIRKKWGFVSFSSDWRNTVLWSHYAEKHKGICLGFDLKRDEFAQKVLYPKVRPRFPDIPDEKTMATLLLCKAPGWAYEKEWRLSATLEDRDEGTGLCFYNFNDDFRLREVIVGSAANDGLTEEVVRAAIGDYPHQVLVKKGRLGFKRFEVVSQKRGFKDPVKEYPANFKGKYPDELLKAAAEVGYEFPAPKLNS